MRIGAGGRGASLPGWGNGTQGCPLVGMLEEDVSPHSPGVVGGTGMGSVLGNLGWKEVWASAVGSGPVLWGLGWHRGLWAGAASRMGQVLGQHRQIWDGVGMRV